MLHSRTKVLFVALSASTHTHSWTSLLDAKAFDARLFGLPIAQLMDDTVSTSPSILSRLRDRGKRMAMKLFDPEILARQQYNLAEAVKQWRPDVVHTLGLDPASYFYLEARRGYPWLADTPWIVTARGGPELALSRLLPEEAQRIRLVLEQCDQFIADNLLNYTYAQELGLAPGKVSPLGAMPGTGGIDIDELAALRQNSASRSRLIVYPKAYECPASKALPVFEALQLAWDRIQPCEIHLTALIPETRMWLATLPEAIRASCRQYDRIPRPELLALMAKARVVLAPSLTDGIPNTLYEAMALGAVPIVSPLDTLRNVFVDRTNVMYARNLYPEEIARTLVNVMCDDALVDSITAANLRLVRELADRREIGRRVGANYDAVARRVAGAAGNR